MAFFYIYVGSRHFIEPEWFVQIMPPFLPYPFQLVYLSGFFDDEWMEQNGFID